MSARMVCLGGPLLALVCGSSLSAADLDPSKLPPAATNKVEFVRDIKPIFDSSCLRCHGPEKPKSSFRLDNREAAIKGGEHGVDITPGQSAKSPLIYYVARLVDDMDMPPDGKGKPLMAEQIGLLRAWIDQGAAWDAGPATNTLDFSMSPVFGGISVSGNSQKFREQYWQPTGLNGGLERFELFEKTDPDTKVTVSGHALRDDYKINLAADRNELGFVHSGWEQYRKYYDATGGYFPALNPVAPSLAGEPHLDIGKAWIDVGLTLPHWPQMVLGYEYDYRRGEETLTSWSLFGPGGGGSRAITPAGQGVREDVHVIKFDLDHEIKGVTLEERFRGEFYSLNTYRTNSDARGPLFENVEQGSRYFQGANTIRLEKKVADWLFGSAGYLYSKLAADGSLTDTFTDSLNNSMLNRVPQLTVDRESHIFNLNALLGPFDGLSLSGGVQSEWTREQGFGVGTLNQFNYALSPFALQPATNTTLSSAYDQSSVSESLSLRYTKIPFTVLFAEARLQQQRIGESDDDLQGSGDYLQRTAFSSQLTDLRFGFNTSPWQRVSFSAHYRRYDNDSRYPNSEPPQPAGGYPGFIGSRDLLTDEIEARLVLRPCAWLKTSLSCQFVTTDFWTETDPPSGNGADGPGGNILSGRQDSQIYSVNATLTPTRRLFLSTSLSYQPTSASAQNNDSPSIAPFRGDIYSVVASGSYVVNECTDLFANYSFSEADYNQDNSAAGLPVGINYQQHAVQAGVTRRFGKNISARLQYGYFSYDEPSSGGANNYTAHAIFGTFTFRLP